MNTKWKWHGQSPCLPSCWLSCSVGIRRFKVNTEEKPKDAFIENSAVLQATLFLLALALTYGLTTSRQPKLTRRGQVQTVPCPVLQNFTILKRQWSNFLLRTLHTHGSSRNVQVAFRHSHTQGLQVCATPLFYPFCRTSLVLNTLSDNPPTFPLLWSL